MWDGPCVQANFEALLSAVREPRTRARLLAAATSESGSWLNAVPASSLGLHMDDDVVWIAVGLRLGAPLCCPHACQLCGAPVDEQATHGLSCIRSAGCQSCHAAINDVVEIIARTNHFVPVVVDTSGAFGTEALDLFAEVARQVRAATQEVRARAFLLQQVSVALERGNAASVLGSIASA